VNLKKYNQVGCYHHFRWLSVWNEGGKPREAEELWEVLQRNSMPPSQYLLLHAEAKLTAAEKEQLIAGLQATMRN
jgi:hypothetical protein